MFDSIGIDDGQFDGASNFTKRSELEVVSNSNREKNLASELTDLVSLQGSCWSLCVDRRIDRLEL